MRKRILLVNWAFNLGGIETAMVNMANELVEFHDVDILVYLNEGLVKERLDKRVRIIEPNIYLQALGRLFPQILENKGLRPILFRLFATIYTKMFDNYLPIKFALKRQPKLKGYDLAIAYHHDMGKKATLSGFSRFVDVCVEAKRKLAWFHYDHTVLDLDFEYNKQFYVKMDKIIFVSRSLMESFSGMHPDFTTELDFCYSFLDYSKIHAQSKEPQDVEYPKNSFVCFSASRLAEEKGFVRAITALKEVFLQHGNLYWYIAGDGPEREAIAAKIDELGLSEKVVLLGALPNPYNYMKNADLVLNVSLHEAAPLVYFEAKALGVPILVTKTSSTEEILTDGYNAFICDKGEEDILNCFTKIIDDPKVLQVIKENLSANIYDNSASLKKVEKWLI